MKLISVQDYRKQFPEYSKDVSDEQIANAIIQQQTEFRTAEGKPNPELDYYQAMKLVNPNSRFVNVDRYKETLDAEDRNKKTDLQFAKEAYEEIKNLKKTNVSFPDFANEFAPRFETVIKGQEVRMPEKEFKPYSSFEIAKVKGYETEGDFPTFGRLATSFAVDRENKIAALNKFGEDYFGQPINVEYDSEIQQLVFFNPTIGKMQTVNKEGLDLGDFAAITGDLGVFVSEVVGSIGGAIGGTYLQGPKTGYATSAGAGTAAAVGANIARLYMGQKFFGLNPELKTEKDFIKASEDVAITSGVGGAVGFLGGLTVKGFNSLRGMGKIKPDVLDGYVTNASKKNELTKKINDKLADRGIKERLNISLAQATDDPELQMYFGALRTQAQRGKVPQMIEFDKNNAEAMMQYYDVIRGPFSVKNLYNKNYDGQRKTLKSMYDIITKETTKDQKFLSEQLAKTQSDLTSEVIQLPSGNFKAGGQIIRNHIQKISEKRRADVAKKFDFLFKADGGQRKVNTDLIKQTINGISEEQKKTLFSMYPRVQDLIKLTGKGGKPIKSVDLKTIHTTRSQLLNHSRSLQKGKIVTDVAPDTVTINKIIKALDKQVIQDLGKNDNWLKFLTKARLDVRNDKKQFAGILGKLIQKKGDRLKIADEDVFITSFKKDEGGQFERIDDVMSVIKTDPMAHDIYKKNVTEFYLDQVDPLRSGKTNLDLHNKFMKDYDYSLRQVFGPEGAKDIKKVGGLQKKITEMEAKNKVMDEKISKLTGGLIAGQEPDKLYSFIFKGGDFGGEEIKRLEDVMNIIKKDDAVKKEFQTIVSERMLYNITDQANFSFKPNAMTKYLDENRKNLEIVFKDNPKYIKDLDEFNEILVALQPKEGLPKPPEKFKGALNDILRTRVGMFTVEGRAMTAAIKLSQSQMNERMFKLLTDPKGLEKMMDFAKKPSRFLETPAGQAAAIDLFGTAPFLMITDGVSPNEKYTPSEVEEVTNQFPEKNEQFPGPGSNLESPTTPDVNIFSEQTPRPTAQEPVVQQPVMASSSMPAPTEGMGIANLPPEQKAAKYAGLFEGDNLGQLIAQRGQNGRT